MLVLPQGMPESWARLLQSANISKTEQVRHPQAVISVLNYYENSSKDKESKYMTNVSDYKPLREFLIYYGSHFSLNWTLLFLKILCRLLNQLDN